jgi:hypothetical protein
MMGYKLTTSHDYFGEQMTFMNVDFGKPIEGIVNEYHEPWRDISTC